MTTLPPAPSLRRPLERHHRALRRALLWRLALRAAAVAALAVALAVAVGVLAAPGVAGSWIRLLAVAAVTLAAALAAGARFARRAPGLDRYLEQVEERFPEVRSWLRNALDLEAAPPAHGSRELAEALADETARRLQGVPLATLAPAVSPRRPLAGFGIASALVVALALIAPARVQRAWATLWNPAAAAPPVRLVVEPGSVSVTPGATLAVRASVWGSARAPHLERFGAGAAVAAAAEGGAEDGAKRWRFDLPPLTREQDYRVRAEQVASDRFHIALAGEPQPVSFEIEYRSPAYARLPGRRGAATRGDLSALRGSRADVLVTFDRDLESLEATLPNGTTRSWTALSPRRWRGEVAIDREGEYRLLARATTGEGRTRYRIDPLADAPPAIAVRVPEGDVDLPAGQQIPLEVLGEDDLGLAELKLQFRKGPDRPWTSVSLQRFPGSPREAQVSSRWDAGVLGLLPGETASFRFELLDDNAVSGPGRALSPTFELRFPSLAEMYDNLEHREDRAEAALQKVSEQAKELQQSLDKLGRQPQRPSATPSFERTEELKQNLARQQELAAKIDEAARELRQNLDESHEREAFGEQLSRKLEELASLMQQIQSPDFREALKKMQQALQNLDSKAMEQNLQDWRKQNQEMMSNLERTLEVLRRLRDEERLEALAKRADELKAQQDALNQQHEAASKGNAEQRGQQAKALAEQQQHAAEQSQALAQDVKDAAEKTESPEDAEARKALEEASQEVEQQATPAQRQAAESAAQQQSQRAQRSGQQASESLSRASQQLHNASRSMQSQREQLELSAIRRAAQDLLSLERSSSENLDSGAAMKERADRQSDLSEGVSRVADSLWTLSRKTPFITPQLAEALGRAMSQMSGSSRELSSGNRDRGESAGKSAAEALNQAVQELRSSESAMCNKPGSGMPGKQSGPQIGEVGEQQSQLNRETGSIARRLSEQMRMTSDDRAELERLGQEQARIRAQLEAVDQNDEARKQVLGRLDQAKREMQEVEEQLRNGDVSGDLEEKQTRILSRLLDAQRSLNRRDFNPERESRPGEEITRRSPRELPEELLRENDRLRIDLLKAEADRYPAQYRAFIEAYLRSLNGSRR